MSKIGYFPVSVIGFADELKAPKYITPELSSLSPDQVRTPDVVVGVRTGASIAMGSVGRTSVLTVTPTTFTASPAKSFFDDYYNRIHVKPKTFDVGFLTSTQVREVEIWNAYVTPQLLNSVDEDNTEGLELTVNPEPPTVFRPLEIRIIELTISVDGPSQIDGKFTLDFPIDKPSIVVTGSRVQVWPYRPSKHYVETLEWLTDVIPAYGAEQRFQMRKKPRQKFEYVHHLDDSFLPHIMGLSRLWNDKLFGVPLWQDGTPVFEDIHVGATEILLNTTSTDYTPGGLCIAWHNETTFSTLEIDKVLPTKLVLKRPVTENIPAPSFVCPLRLSLASTGVNIEQSHNNEIIVSTGFLAYDVQDVSSNPYVEYKSLPVLTDRTVKVGNITSNIRKNLVQVDNNINQPYNTLKDVLDSNTHTLGMLSNTRDAEWKIRQFLHYLKGRLRPFWLVNWNNTLTVINDINVGVNLTITPIQVGTFYPDGLYIMMLLKDGTRLFRKVVSGVVTSPSSEIVLVDEAFESFIAVSDIQSVTIMNRVRLDTDTIQITHTAIGQCSLSATVKEIKDDVQFTR